MSGILPPPDNTGFKRIPRQIRSVAKAPRGKRIAVVKGQDNGRFMDFYHNILIASWPWFFAQLAAAYRAKHGAVLLQVEPDGLTFQFFSVDNELIDTFKVTRR